MELIGDEKRIRALYSEVRFADRQAAPSFTATWHRAQSRVLWPRRAFNLSFVAATALLVFTLGALAIWSKYSQPTERSYSAFATVPARASLKSVAIQAGEPVIPTATTKKPNINVPGRLKLVSQKQALTVAANRKAEKQAKQLATWQSPTASLLTSSSDELFKSLPQLNENANGMKSFLPNRSNDKEK